MLRIIIVKAFELFQLVLLVWCFMSFVPDFRASSFYRALDGFFSYLLAPIRKVIPPIGGTIDISPIILLFGLQFIVQFLVKLF